MPALILPRRSARFIGPLLPAPEWGATLLFANGQLWSNATGELPLSVATGRAGGITYGSGPVGPTTEFNGSNTMIWTDPVLPRYRPEGTIIAIHRPTANPTAGRIVAGGDYNSDDTLFMLSHQDGLNAAQFRSDGQWDSVIVNGSTNTLGVTVTTGAVFRWFGEKSVWKNGVKENFSSTAWGTSSNIFNFRNFTIGALRRGANNFFYPGGITFAAVLPYALPDDLMADAMSDPWQLLQSRPQRLYFDLGVTVGAKTLDAAAQATATATAQLAKGVSLAGASLAVASATAAMSHVVPLAASAQAQASANGQVALTVNLTANAVAAAIASGNLALGKPLVANAQGQSTATNTLSLVVNLSAVVMAQAQATASFGGSASLAATAIANAQASAALAVGKPLAAAATAQASAGASLLLQVPLTAVALAQASAQGGLRLVVNLSATALASAQAGATLAQQLDVRLEANAHAQSTASATLQFVLQDLNPTPGFQVATSSRAHVATTPHRSFALQVRHRRFEASLRGTR